MLDAKLKRSKARITESLTASGTSLIEILGDGRVRPRAEPGTSPRIALGQSMWNTATPRTPGVRSGRAWPSSKALTYSGGRRRSPRSVWVQYGGPP